MFLYFKRREKRGKREAPWPRFLVLRRKTLTVGAALLAAAAIFGAVNAPAAVRASVATRQLPIYCVERDQKVCSISFDAAWGADNTQKILDVLADYGVKTTFFVAGNWADQYSYVGNTYTVNNDDQRSSEVFLEYRIADDNGQWSADEINITVSLKLKDGTTLEKELLVCPTYDSTTRNVEISVKDAEKWNG